VDASASQVFTNIQSTFAGSVLDLLAVSLWFMQFKLQGIFMRVA